MKPETQYKLLVKVASADRAAGILARIAGAQQVKQAAQQAKQAAQQKKAVDASTLINAGAGVAGGALGAGAGYALSGLSPAMKKKKLYRILAALAGGAAGAGAGVAGGIYGQKGMKALNGLKQDAAVWRELQQLGNDYQIGQDDLGYYTRDPETGTRTYSKGNALGKLQDALNVRNNKVHVENDYWNSVPHNKG